APPSFPTRRSSDLGHVAGEDSAEDVEAGLDLGAALIADLDDLGSESQAVLQPVRLAGSEVAVVQRQVGVGVEAQPVAAVEPHLRRVCPGGKKAKSHREGAKAALQKNLC